MKLRNKIITGLIAAGIASFLIIQGINMPVTDQSSPQNPSDTRDPLTQDFSSIYEYRNNYMGNASNLTALFYGLPLGDLEMSFKLHPETFAAEVSYKAEASGMDGSVLDRALVYNATAAFSLIDNLESVTFNFEGATFKIYRNDVEKWYGIALSYLAEEEAWKVKVQSSLKDEGYVQDCLNAIVAHEGRTVADTLKDFYGNTSEPIIIYDEMPFEDGILVLAEKPTDGEHYPDLHYIDDRNRVAYLTRGSDCWTLNYTEFKGRYIYFGLAGAEVRRYSGNQIPVEKLEVLFSDRIASVIPREGDGYILPVEGRDMPEDIIAVMKNGERKSVARLYVERSKEHMPDYLKSKNREIYNSFAFTFTPMLTPVEWNKGYKEGEISLEGGTDSNGNRNVLYLRPAGHMSFADSFVLPQDIKPLYLSDNYARIARFQSEETVTVRYPEGRGLVDCLLLKLTRERIEKETGQDSFEAVEVNAEGQLKLPKEKGYYLFLLRTVENDAIQTYTGMLIIV